MIKARTLESRGNVFTLFTGCAQIYHQRWYVRPSGSKFHLHGLLQRAVRQRQAHMGELQSPIGAKVPPLPPSELCVQTKAKVRLLSAHKVYECAPLLYRQNVGVAYG
ncbi:hypothetical protein D7V86_10275 [bacterium D16-51]|nr:hypothetical protein D7V96_10700 [bacterium D16-59]RKI60047.1 hypothetical protein D7V86_10275 [bacterium D16-51]